MGEINNFYGLNIKNPSKKTKQPFFKVAKLVSKRMKLVFETAKLVSPAFYFQGLLERISPKKSLH